MKCHLLSMILIYLFTVAEPATADTLVIKYSSGKVQTVQLDEPRKEVQSIEFNDSSSSLPEKEKNSLGKKPLPDEVDSKEPHTGAKKSGPTFKWAPPLSE